jgi:small-conductance mechanosensitive channel
MPLSNLLSDLFDDLRDPRLMWQLAAIAGCVVLGWLLARLVRRAFLGKGGEGHSIVEIGVLSFAQVLSPLLIVGLLALAKLGLQRYHINVNVLRVAMPIFGSLAVIRAVFFLLRRVFARRGHAGGAVVLAEKVFALLVWLAVTLYIVGLWPEIFDFLDHTVLPLGQHKVSLLAILQAGASVVVLLMLALWAGAALEERLMGMESVHSSLRAVLSRMSRAVLIVVAVLLSLSMVGIDLTVLSVFGGALGVGLGLGMQKIASNYVSGFVILIERSLSIGDMISVDKYSGRVTQINTRYTVLQALDGTESVLPNEMLISGPVQNLSLSSPQVRIATNLTVAFDTNLQSLFARLEQLCLGVERVLADPPPQAMLRAFGNDGFEIEVGLWIADPENGRGGLLSDINLKIWALLQEEGVSLPYPTRDLRFTDPGVAQGLAALSTQNAK